MNETTDPAVEAPIEETPNWTDRAKAIARKLFPYAATAAATAAVVAIVTANRNSDECDPNADTQEIPKIDLSESNES